jgi:hypothetical protein
MTGYNPQKILFLGMVPTAVFTCLALGGCGPIREPDLSPPSGFDPTPSAHVMGPENIVCRDEVCARECRDLGFPSGACMPGGSCTCSGDPTDDDDDDVDDDVDDEDSGEICDDGMDNNGDGRVDEGCGCDIGSALPCYSGPPETRSTGTCRDGVMTCIASGNGSMWDGCEGELLPGPEMCDGLDNDCNGSVDDGPRDSAAYEDDCGDGEDNDCDGAVDCMDADCPPCCEPSPEDCVNGLDDDCDGLVDCGDPDCVSRWENCTNGIDDDCDGLVDCSDPGCAAMPENCGNNLDDNCDGVVDCQDPSCSCVPEVCFDEWDNNGDGLVDCTAAPDPECPCAMLSEGCRQSQRVALVLPAVTPPVDVFNCTQMAATPYVLNPYDTVLFSGPMNDSRFRTLDQLYRSGRKVILFMTDADWGYGYGEHYWDLEPHFHALLTDMATSIAVTESNTMSRAFDKRSYPGIYMVQVNTLSTSWCGDLFFDLGAYTGHLHGYRQDTAWERGALIVVGLYSGRTDVADFSGAFVNANLQQSWNPGPGTSAACGLACTRQMGYGIGKPAVYLYPEEEQLVTVQLDFDGEIVTTYPPLDEDIGGWQVLASPDGTLLDVRDGHPYSYLFWNGVTADFEPDLSEGFVVRGEETIGFLQDTLSDMGLLPAEYNELILYWLPYMEHHAYNLIHFAGREYTDIARMTITPAPDSLLRVFMVFMELDEPVSIPPQAFEPFERRGFTAVEWGGSEIAGDWHVVR